MNKSVRIHDIERRLECASPGPWFGQYIYDGARTICTMRSTDTTFCVNVASHVNPLIPTYDNYKENAQFIAWAREDIAFLLGEIAQYRSVLEQVAKMRTSMGWLSGAIEIAEEALGETE